MAFDVKKFYDDLDAEYDKRDNAGVERFMVASRDAAYKEGRTDGRPNMAYVAVCNEMACFYRGLSRWQESLETFSQAQAEFEETNQADTLEYATVILNKAGTYRYMRDLENSLKYFKKSASIAEQSGYQNEGMLSGLYNNIGLVYLDLKDPEQAIYYFNKALAIVSMRGDMLVETGTTWNNLAAAYNFQGNREAAMNAVNHAVDILGKINDGDNCHYPAALNTRGNLEYHSGNYENALVDFTDALKTTKIVYGENVEYMYGCQNCAVVCRELGRIEEAGKWSDKADEIRKKLEQESSFKL